MTRSQASSRLQSWKAALDKARIRIGGFGSRLTQPGGEAAMLNGLLIGGLAITALSLLLLWTTPHPFVNMALTSASLCLFLTGLLSEDVPFVRHAGLRAFFAVASFFEVSPLQAVGLPLGLLLSLASWSASGSGAVAHLPGAWAIWMMGITVTVFALWRPSPSPARPGKDRLHFAIWMAILSLALALRVIAVGDVPAAVSGDEGSVGIVGWEFVSGLRSNLFSSAWHSLPSLYFGLVSIFQRMLGRDLEAIRLTSALGGALSVVALYWATGKLFGRTTGLVGAAFLATYHVHVLFSRIATASVWDGAFFSAALGGLWIGATKGERSGFILAGLAAGISHYFHPMSRLILLYALLWTILFLPRIRRGRRLAGLWAGALVALAVLLPLALYFAAVPPDYFAPFRAGSVTGEIPLLAAISENPEATVPLLAAQLRASFLGIFARPLDGVYTPGTALLLPMPAVVLAAGLVFAFVRERDARLAALLVAFVGPLVVGAVSIEAPNVEMLQTLAAPAAMLIALPLSEGLDWARRFGESARYAALALVAGVVILMAGLEIRHTLAERPPFAPYAGPTAALAWELGDALAGTPQGTPVYLFGWPRIAFAWEPGLVYMAAGLEAHDALWPIEAGHPLPSPGTHAVFLIVPEQIGVLEEVGRIYPDARVTIHPDTAGGVRFAMVEVGR